MHTTLEVYVGLWERGGGYLSGSSSGRERFSIGIFSPLQYVMGFVQVRTDVRTACKTPRPIAARVEGTGADVRSLRLFFRDRTGAKGCTLARGLHEPSALKSSLVSGPTSAGPSNGGRLGIHVAGGPSVPSSRTTPNLYRWSMSRSLVLRSARASICPCTIKLQLYLSLQLCIIIAMINCNR